MQHLHSRGFELGRGLRHGLSHGPCGLAIDIDGVLLRGSKILPRASEALRLLHEAKLPHIFMTNGGGCTEAKKAADLTAKLGVEVRESQILLSHTPYKQYVERYRDQPILVLGHAGCRKVAKSYGFQKIVTPAQILRNHPLVYPGHRDDLVDPEHQKACGPIAAAFVFHDPLDWAVDFQILTDVLLGMDFDRDFTRDHLATHDHLDHSRGQSGQSGQDSQLQHCPLFSCNADLVYTTEFLLPRFTQGAFTESFRALFEKYTGRPLQVDYCGKPFPVQYTFAERMLAEEAQRLGVPQAAHYFGIGDNPLSDIQGANGAGDNWNSILVRTGVFKGQDNDAQHPADLVTDDILTAVQAILQA